MDTKSAFLNQITKRGMGKLGMESDSVVPANFAAKI